MPRGKTSTKLCDKCNHQISLFAFNRHYKTCDGLGPRYYKKKDYPEDLRCPHCNKMNSSKFAYSCHVRLCEENPNKSSHNRSKDKSEYECKFCGKICIGSSSLNNHSVRCKNNPNRKIQTMTEAGKLRSIETRIKKGTLKYSDERKANHSIAMKFAVEKYPDSYSSSNRGRSKQIIKYGIKFQSSWELIFYEYCINQSIKIEKNKKWFPYEWEGNRKYNPDFYLAEFDVFIEVKGYKTDRDEAKWAQFPTDKKLIIIEKYDIIDITKYNKCVTLAQFGRAANSN